MSDQNKIRSVILETVELYSSSESASLQSGSVLDEVGQRLDVSRGDTEMHHAILTEWHKLFTTGVYAWGNDLRHSESPWFHVTASGRDLNLSLSRDPGNPDGYLNYLESKSELSDISKSYIGESLQCFSYNQYKSAAVMLGAASERCVLDVVDAVKEKLNREKATVPKGLNVWQIKKLLDALKAYFESEKKNIPYELYENFEAYWPAFTQQIRVVRNDVGHPNSVTPVTEETVRAGLLVFPAIAELSSKLIGWCE